MDIFDEVQQVLADRETPRDFPLATLGEKWWQATIVHYRMRTDSDIRCYLAVLSIRCLDCGEPTMCAAVFTQDEQGGYRLLHPEQSEVIL